jgi:hypothetical protein
VDRDSRFGMTLRMIRATQSETDIEDVICSEE